MEDEDERCPDVDFYEYSLEPFEPKEKEIPEFEHKEQNYYDFNLHFMGRNGGEEIDLINLEGKDLVIRGKVTFKDKFELDFFMGVNAFVFHTEVVDEDDPDILILNKKAKKFKSIDLYFELGELSVYVN